MSDQKTIFISADHGLAVVYFLQSDVVPTLLKAGIQVVVLTDDGLKEKLAERFGQPGLVFEGLRFDKAYEYEKADNPALQYWLTFFRRAGASAKINRQAADSFVYQVEQEAGGFRRKMFWLMRFGVWLFAHFKFLRKWLVNFQQNRFNPKIYTDLFETYQPEMMVASTPGWRMDRYLLREAAARGITTTTVIVGWDNSSSYNISGAKMDYAICWSELQKQELVDGSDWDPNKIRIGGIPSYDGYINDRWLIPREDYFKLHGLDPNRKLISYASSFISFSPNIQNVQALAELVSGDDLTESSQLLVRLHPNHFMDVARFAKEREQVRELVKALPHVHLVEPVAMGGELGHYSGEDMDEKTSFMAYSDVFVTVYSTMVVEASIHARPVVAAVLDSDEGWPGFFTLPLSKIGGWPTHDRFLKSNSGRVAHTKQELGTAINDFLKNPDEGKAARRTFVERECTYLDGSAGRRTAEYLISFL